MDIATIIGWVLALAGIVGGLIIEGGNIGQLTQPTAFMIVMGGTIGAVMVQFPMATFLAGMKAFITIILPKGLNGHAVIEDLVKYATKARKEGIISLEGDVKAIKDEFLKKALTMAIDGADPKELKHTLETELGYIETEGALPAKVAEAAGGYAPTIGIIGAVMGLIQVMGHLDNIEEVGHGIATAFVATIYGVAFSNIVFLPAAGKITLAHKRAMVVKEMIIEGVAMIVEGVNPMVIRDKLAGFLVEKAKAAKGAAKEEKK